MQLAQILLPIAFDKTFSYYIPEGLEIGVGDMVLVSFTNRNIYGIVLEITENNSEAEFKIKTIISKDENLKIDKNLIKLIEFAADYNLAPKGLFLKLAISILNSSKPKKKPKVFPEIDESLFDLRKLSPKQQKIADSLKTKTTQNQHSVTLIDGITGSGKTEVYFDVIAKILKEKSGQVLILLPEIILTGQLIKRFEAQFNFKPEIWHSKISNGRKRDIFYALNSGEIRILIATRSAIFLPFSDLKLIVVDEEHETSFKQEDIVNYHGRDMAIARAKFENIPIILSSATPSIETFVNTQNGKYDHLILENKFFENAQTKIHLIDMKKEKIEKNSFISQNLKTEIAHALEHKKQSLLFLNRRGYAPLTLCKSCGFKISCAHCSSYMSYHQSVNKLICHHCGDSERIKTSCNNCKAENSFVTLGAGVEKINEEIRALFPEAIIAIMTSDTLNVQDEISEIITQIINNEVDIIIGTQIIAKGHHFPHLALVGIIDGDSSFNNANLRSAERSYQLLTQVIGRAGREKHNAQVFLQSYNVENLVFKYIVDQNRDDFFNLEIQNRELMQMPPFGKMIALIFISKQENLAIDLAKFIMQKFPQQENIEIFGPAPMPISKIRKQYYYRLLIKSDKKLNIQKLIKNIIATCKIPNQVRLKIDVDPL